MAVERKWFDKLYEYPHRINMDNVPFINLEDWINQKIEWAYRCGYDDALEIGKNAHSELLSQSLTASKQLLGQTIKVALHTIPEGDGDSDSRKYLEKKAKEFSEYKHRFEFGGPPVEEVN